MTIYQKIVSAFGSLRESIVGKANRSEVAPEFDASEEYVVGSIVIKDGILQRCTRAGVGGSAVFAPDVLSQSIPESGVQSDWDETDDSKPSYIRNKPVIPAPQVQADWEEDDATSMSYVRNKPDSMPPTAHASTHGEDGLDAISPESIGAIPEYSFSVASLQPSGGSASCTLVPFANNMLDATGIDPDEVSSISLKIGASPVQGRMRDVWLVVKCGSYSPDLEWPAEAYPEGGDYYNFIAKADSTTIFIISEYGYDNFIVSRHLIGLDTPQGGT